VRFLKAVWRFILPEDLAVRKRRLELAIWAFLLSLAYYPGYFGVLAWVALARPIIILSRLETRQVFGAAYWFAFWFNTFSLYWVAMVTPPGTVMAVLIVSFYYAGMLVVFHRLYRWRRAIGFVLLPLLWVGMEYFRTLSEFAFPWSDLGYTQAYFRYILQIVSIVSVHGLSLLIVAVNILVVQILRSDLSPERRLTSFFVSVACVALLVAYGWIVTPPYIKPGPVKVALLQGSVPLEIKWAREKRENNLILYDSLTQTVTDPEVDLFIWPETSVPCYISHDYGCRRWLGEIVSRSDRRHLVGALSAKEIDSRQLFYNSAYQFGADGRIEQTYRKVKLVPFSEQVPYQDHLPFLRAEVLEKYLTFIKTYDVQWWSDFYPGDSTGFSRIRPFYGAAGSRVSGRYHQ
jgi:apolipoprotein N-acyltransferase